MAARLEGGLAAYAADPGWAARLRAQAQRFQWETAARQYLALYQELAGSGPCGTKLPLTRGSP
jgi:hypothetical protein